MPAASDAQPDENPASLRKIATTLRERGKLAESEAALRKAVALAPVSGAAHADLGLTLIMLGRASEAERSLRRALEINPRDSFALSNLGAALIQMKRPREAADCFREVLGIEPGQTGALRNLGVILRDFGRLEEAKAYFLKASKSDSSIEVSLQAYLGLSPMTNSVSDIAGQRTSYASGLEAFASSLQSFRYNGERINVPWFYLAYHGEDDSALLKRTAAVLGRKLALDQDARSKSLGRSVDDSAPLRVVFCSDFLHDHTIGKLYIGLIKHLDRRKFEVLVAHGPFSLPGTFRDTLDSFADAAVVLPRAPDAQRDIIFGLRPDVLFFPDIGMSPQTYCLAQARLAPVQAVGWGHPNTTGLSTIDYFVSCDSIEPDGAEAMYSEQLVKLPRLPAFYEEPARAPAISKETLHLPQAGVLYGCPQSLFKFHPEFDAVLAEIAKGDPSGTIVLIEGPNPAWGAVLRERWKRTHPELLDRVLFLPRLSQAAFMAILAHFDVLLDPLHFGSGNTLYEAMACGTPIVTWPSRFMRGRIVSGAYAQMGVNAPPIAQRVADYAQIALQLGRDAPRRADLRTELVEKARRHLYEDRAAIRAFEQFITCAVAVAEKGEKLPAGWRPSRLEENP